MRLVSRFGRSRISTTFGAVALALALLVGMVGDAGAGRTWCRMDPVIKIDGKVADIWLNGAVELNSSATGPAQIVVRVPLGVRAEVLATDLGFNKQGYVITFREDPSLGRNASGPQIVIWASVPSPDDSLPLEVVFAPRSAPLPGGSAMGVSGGVALAIK